MHHRFRSFTFLAVLLTAATAFGQFKDADPEGTKMGEAKAQKWQAGIAITASAGPCKNVHGYAPIPIEWPEQQVTIVKEEVSPGAKVAYEDREGTAKIMKIEIPSMSAGQEIKAVVTLEILRNAILPPDDTDQFVLPNVKKLPPNMRKYITPSPLIESTDPKIKALSKEIGEEKEMAWEKVEAYYDWVRKNVKYTPGQIKGALAALKDETGDCEEMTSLFIALCRASDIPARTVWVPGHCYPEFYLEDAKGEGHWFPCQAAGSREFGGIVETRPILQKGDNFQPHPGQKKHQRYLAEFLTGTPVGNAGKPTIRAVRELLP
jgi:hypothetical protein